MGTGNGIQEAGFGDWIPFPVSLCLHKNTRFGFSGRCVYDQITSQTNQAQINQGCTPIITVDNRQAQTTKISDSDDGRQTTTVQY